MANMFDKTALEGRMLFAVPKKGAFKFEFEFDQSK